MINAMPALIRLYMRSIGWGLALGLIFTALLLAADVAGLRHLLLSSRAGGIAIGLLMFFHGILFAGVQFAIAVMTMAEDRDDDPGAGRRRRDRRESPKVITRAFPVHAGNRPASRALH